MRFQAVPDGDSWRMKYFGKLLEAKLGGGGSLKLNSYILAQTDDMLRINQKRVSSNICLLITKLRS